MTPVQNYTVFEVARMFRCSPSTVRRWIKDGDLHAIKVLGRDNPRGRWLITSTAVQDFLAHEYKREHLN